MSSMELQVFAWIMENSAGFYYFSFVLAIPATVLYILEIFTILWHKNRFGTSFFRLFCVRAISDIIQLAASCYGNRMPTLFGAALLPLYRTFPNWCLSGFYVGTTYTYIVTNVATAVMLLNRFTAVCCPLRQEKIWRKLFFPVLFFMLAVPAYMVAPIFGMQTTFMAQNNGSSFVIYEKTTPAVVLAYANNLKAVSSIVFLAICLLANACTLIAYKRVNKMASDACNAADKKIEQKLMIYSVLTCAGHALLATFLYACYHLTNTQYISVVYVQYPWITDLNTTVLSSWMLLWASESVRRQLLVDFCPRALRRQFAKSSTGPAVAPMVANNNENNNRLFMTRRTVVMAVQPKSQSVA